MTTTPNLAPARAHEELLIAFTDISGYSRATAGRTDEEMASMAEAVMAATTAAVEGSGGTLVKHLGDGSLAVWPVAKADMAAMALLSLREEINRILGEQGWQAELTIRVHAGPAVAGEFGDPARFDVIGHAVMTAARLPARTVSFSQAAFRALGAETRKKLKKHTEPVIYIPNADPRP